MNLLKPLTHLKAAPAATKPGQAREATLLHCGSQVLVDLFVPGRQGEKARIHSQYQLCKKLGVHQALEAQAHPAGVVSQTVGALRQVGTSGQEALAVARDYWRDEARTAQGPYRALVGAMQGCQSTGQGLFSTAKSLAKLGLNSAWLTYRGLKGEVNFSDLLAQGGETALRLVERGSRYVVSGRLPDDAKKFAKDCTDYSAEYLRKIKNDPGLEIPKLLAVLGTGAAVGGGINRGLGMAGKLAAAEVKVGEMAAAAPKFAGALAEPGTIVPRNWALRGSVPLAPTRVAPPAPAAVAAPVAPLPVVPAPVLTPRPLPLPTRTPVCLPFSNYAPAPRGGMQPFELLETTLDIVG